MGRFQPLSLVAVVFLTVLAWAGSAAAQAPVERPGALEGFFGALAAREAGERTRPVTILHLGDSHIARDGLSGPLRDLFQDRFGGAARGMLPPGHVYAWFAADGVEVAQSEGWEAVSALPPDAGGVFGVASGRITASRAGEWLALLGIEDDTAAVTIGYWRQPDGGSFTLTTGQAAQTVSTDGAGEPGFVTVPLSSVSGKVHVTLTGDGPVTLTSLTLEPGDRGGVRLINLGVPGATIDIMSRWRDAVIAAELSRLKPDLIILGYGTNEAFDDALDLDAYRTLYASQVARLKRLAPDASLLAIGGPDGARLPFFADPLSRPPDDWDCAPLTAAERDGYAELVADEVADLLRWHDPPSLGPLFALQSEVAAEQVIAYWPWRQAMGGACAIHDWRLSAPALARGDHVHLSSEGNSRAARLLFDALMAGYEAYKTDR